MCVGSWSVVLVASCLFGRLSPQRPQKGTDEEGGGGAVKASRGDIATKLQIR